MKIFTIIILLFTSFASSAQNSNSRLMNKIYQKYQNQITLTKIYKSNDQHIIQAIPSATQLPLSVVQTLNSEHISLYENPIFISFWGSGLFILNNFSTPNNIDMFQVHHNGRLHGYIFNISQCEEDVCYEFDALYLNHLGQILHKTY